MSELEYIYNTFKSTIVELTHDRGLIEKYLIPSEMTRSVSKMFVRDTKFSLLRLLMFMIMPRTDSCQSELMAFYGGMGMEVPTKSAFSIKRNLVSHELFQFLNAELLESFYRTTMPKRWKGKFIIAVDGTTLTMPRGARFEALYGYSTLGQENSPRMPTARAIVLSDVLSHQILSIRLDRYGAYEAEMAYRAICDLPDYIRDNAIFIFDRLFISSWFLTALQNMGIQYVMRCRRGQSKAIDKFWDSNLTHQDIQICMSSASWSAKGKARYQKNGITPDRTRPVFVHLSKSKLPHGEYEVICSKVFGINLSPAQAYRLYGYRWEAETAIGIEKNQWQIEIFSGYSRNAILQDIYCKVISYNMCSMATMVANKRLKVRSGKKIATCKKSVGPHPGKKRRYKVNLNMALYNLKQFVIKIATNRIKLHILIVRYIRVMCRYYEPTQKDRHNDRNFGLYKINGKYATYTNYARVL